MQRWAIICAVLLSCTPVLPGDRQPTTDRFEVGRHTFYDFGPPFDFYEIFVVRPAATGTSIEQIILTPPGGSCMQPARVEAARSSLSESVDDLLGKANPCLIPEKELRREMKRCKKCLVFSGANVAMQVHCGSDSRIIRAQVLDKDMFDAAPNTPKHTSWTMQLLNRMSQAVGSDVMDKPVFAISEQNQKPLGHLDALQDVRDGKYDDLFQGSPHKPSELYRVAQKAIPTPDIHVDISGPFRPEVVVPPIYPPIARLAHIEGTVTITFKVSEDGSASSLHFDEGHPMLRGAVEKALNAWKFQTDAAHEQVHATIEFKANCPIQTQ